MNKIIDFLLNALVYIIFLGFGVLIWWLCRPSMTIKETAITIVVSYVVFLCACVIAGTPGVGAIPVKNVDK